MLLTCAKFVESTAVHFTLDDQLDLQHARWLRGAIGRVMDRPEFHHHAERGIVYQHPLIRYDVSGNQAMILGLAEGRFLLRSLPALENVAFGW